tara:strand:+ start:123 stop:365 length:243 start_codon:yes stop_codon:yes gene_type:complete
MQAAIQKKSGGSGLKPGRRPWSLGAAQPKATSKAISTVAGRRRFTVFLLYRLLLICTQNEISEGWDYALLFRWMKEEVLF